MKITEQPSPCLLSETISKKTRISSVLRNLSTYRCARNTRFIFFMSVLVGMLGINVGICSGAGGENGGPESLAGTCTESKPAETKVSGSGPHDVKEVPSAIRE
jgi:hypothetical protein